MSADHYRTPASRAEFRQKIERSEFLAIVVPVADVPEFLGELEECRKRYFDATHHCWAVRPWNGESRSNDDGEPSGTAGKPILSAIEGAGLHDCGVIVVRWYGGIKLGTGGLSRAYRETAAEALRAVPLVDRYIYRRFRLEVPFKIIGAAYRLLAPPDVVLVAEQFGETNTFELDVRESMAETFGAMLTEKRIRWSATTLR